MSCSASRTAADSAAMAESICSPTFCSAKAPKSRLPLSLKEWSASTRPSDPSMTRSATGRPLSTRASASLITIASFAATRRDWLSWSPPADCSTSLASSPSASGGVTRARCRSSSIAASSPSGGNGWADIPTDSTGGLRRPPAGDVPGFTSASRAAPCHTRGMRARDAFRFGWTVFAAAIALAPATALAATPHIEQADLNGDINNVMSSYMQNAVSRAESDHADALLVVMNTPGGISTSMDEIVTSLLNSKVPVIVYVYPSGARAASAGLFVAQAADVLAMAPGTNIGSAHPIQSTGEDLTGDLGAKVLNDAVTRVRSLASMHGRNADWAEDAVRNSVNIDAEQAVRLHVADLVASDIPSLLSQVDGRQVPRTGGSLTIRSANGIVDDFPMPVWQVFLNALIDPTIAALLIIVAGYGIITEMSNPGLILPGVIGGIAAVLAIVSLANLPLNVAGALMMLLALVLFIADLKAPTHGFLSVGGVFALVLGMAFLINTGPIGLGVNPIVSLVTALITLGFFAFFIRKVLAARRQPAFVGADSMLGALGEVREEISPEGLVFVGGALWKATAASPIPAGSPVRVVGRDGLELKVARENGVAGGETKEKS